MDSMRFDTLSKQLATGATRRRAIAGLGALALGGAGVLGLTRRRRRTSGGSASSAASTAAARAPRCTCVATAAGVTARIGSRLAFFRSVAQSARAAAPPWSTIAAQPEWMVGRLRTQDSRDHGGTPGRIQPHRADSGRPSAGFGQAGAGAPGHGGSAGLPRSREEVGHWVHLTNSPGTG